MTEPSRPVPGPPRPGPVGAPVTGAVGLVGAAAVPVAPAGTDPDGTVGTSLAGLDQRPVAEHVAAFEAEHDRLRRELATIDQL
jgi:hypothetical protein